MAEERRLVTVLFADVTGSTSLAEELDPEDLRALLARYYDIARDVIATHDGTLEKFIGDAVMAVFGLPVAHGDDASRALAASLQLRDRVRDDAQLGERLPIRVGVNTGEVVATREVENGSDFMVTGDAVNVAARLVQGAAPWTVVAGERTVHAAADFSFAALEPVEARGKAAPVRAAEVVGRAPVERRPLPLLGRDADLAQLELVAGRSFSERRPYLVSVIAPAGTGKTRLLEEFISRLEDHTPECLIATAQCLPYGQRLTFWPLRAILHTIVGATDETAPERLRELVIERLTALGIADAPHVATRLLATVGASDEEVVDRTDLYAAWRTTLERVAAERPSIVVFEDLHWSSDSFLDLVEYVTQPRGEARLLMIVLTRPELLDRRPAWGGGRRNHVSLALDRLDVDSIADLVRHLLESASAETVGAVATRAEGNPFYAGELVRSLIDRLGPNPHDTDVEQALLSLPDTVQATVLARLDSLPPAERRCLQLGSVFGRSFRPNGIAALEPAASETVHDALDALLEREMVRLSGADSYAFRHILIREVAYSTLPRAERARLHDAAGRWLELGAAGNEEAYAELIAFHYREAATLSHLMPGEAAGDVKSRAVDWLRRAAETALAAGADVEARGHLMTALEWAPPEVLPDIHERIGDAYVGGDATIEAYSNAYRLARDAGRPPNDVLRVLGKLIEYEARFQGSVGSRMSSENMTQLVATGRELLPQATDQLARARLHLALGFLPWWNQAAGVMADETALAEAEQDALIGLRYAEGANDAELWSAALDALDSLAIERGDWRLSREYARQRLEFRERLPIGDRVDAHSMAAWAAAALGDLAEAEQITQEGLSGLQPGQAPSMALHLVNWRIQVLHSLGRWDEALAMAARAERLWVEINRPAAQYAQRGFLCALDVSRARRDPDGVDRWKAVLHGIDAGASGTDYTTEVTRLHTAGDVEQLAEKLGRLRPSSIPALYAQALSLCSDHLLPIAEDGLDLWLNKAKHDQTALLEGQARRAKALFGYDPDEARRALAIFERCGAAPAAARVRCEIGLMTGDYALYDAGAKVLASLGDIDQLERYEARRLSR
jgi:class 3 adenylate cyclase